MSTPNTATKDTLKSTKNDRDIDEEIEKDIDNADKILNQVLGEENVGKTTSANTSESSSTTLSSALASSTIPEEKPPSKEDAKKDLNIKQNSNDTKKESESKEESFEITPEYIFTNEKKLIVVLHNKLEMRNVGLHLYYSAMIKVGEKKVSTEMNMHNTAFYNFLEANEKGIKNSNVTGMTNWTLKYSKKLFIDMKEVFNLLETKEKNIFWKHLQTLYTLHFPKNSTELIEQLTTHNESNEAKCLKNVMGQVSKLIPSEKDMKDPTEALSLVSSSGEFSSMIGDIVSKLNSGELDIGSLLNVVGNQMGTLMKGEKKH
jgi:hypothetical protein